MLTLAQRIGLILTEDIARQKAGLPSSWHPPKRKKKEVVKDMLENNKPTPRYKKR